jgi:hypothetical protein
VTSYSVPANHQVGDPTGHTSDHNTISADLALIGVALPVVEGGLAGATAATRFAGATSSGAPGSGTFAAGDFVIDVSGSIWICTAGGTPGTWAQVGAGGGGAMINPMTTAGDLIKGAAAGTPARLGIGSSGQALIVSGGAPAWGAVGFAGGGTGQATQQAALDAVAGAVTANQVLAGNGTHVTLRALAAADIPQLTNYAPTGLSGATTAVRFAGGTTSGAPASGTFATGDFVVTADGHIFVCTAGGSPGTWANAGASAGVSTFNSRSGAVTPGNADYLAVAAGGLAGATTGTRFAGATTGGAPASGTFATGDLIVDTSGNLWVCTSGGSPGTWVKIRGGTAPAATAPAVVALTDAATILVDASLGNDLRVTLGGNRTIGAPSNPADGQRIVFHLTQDGTGSRTVTWTSTAGGYSFGSTGTAPILTTTAGKTDLVGFIYNTTIGKWLYAGSSLLGF